MNKMAVLLVDDETMILESLRLQLRRCMGDVAIECASSPSEAMEVLDELSDDGVAVLLVVSDWLMPGVRGDVFLADVQLRFPSIKRVLLTGQADVESLKRIRRDGVAHLILYKPWSEQDLHDALALVETA